MSKFDGDQSKRPFKFHRPCSKISDIKHKTTQKELSTFLKNNSYFTLKVIFDELDILFQNVTTDYWRY